MQETIRNKLAILSTCFCLLIGAGMLFGIFFTNPDNLTLVIMNTTFLISIVFSIGFICAIIDKNNDPDQEYLVINLKP